MDLGDLRQPVPRQHLEVDRSVRVTDRFTRIRSVRIPRNAAAGAERFDQRVHHRRERHQAADGRRHVRQAVAIEQHLCVAHGEREPDRAVSGAVCAKDPGGRLLFEPLAGVPLGDPRALGELGRGGSAAFGERRVQPEPIPQPDRQDVEEAQRRLVDPLRERVALRLDSVCHDREAYEDGEADASGGLLPLLPDALVLEDLAHAVVAGHARHAATGVGRARRLVQAADRRSGSPRIPAPAACGTADPPSARRGRCCRRSAPSPAASAAAR